MNGMEQVGLDEFCRAQYEPLVGALSLHCGDAHVAEELAQEAIARLCRHWSKVRIHPAPEAWLFRVAFNLSSSRWRRLVVERRVKERLAREDVTPEAPDLLAADAVRRAISKLPKRQRTALIYRYFLDMPVAQVATLMECSDGTVKALTYQAIKALRRDASVLTLQEVPDGV